MWSQEDLWCLKLQDTAKGEGEHIFLRYDFLYFGRLFFLKFLLLSIVPVPDIYICLLTQFGMSAFFPTSLLLCVYVL